jgi:phosphotransferase system enzyme I (PtsI)
MDSAKINSMRTFSGIAASPGISVGRLRVVDRHHIAVDEYPVRAEGIAPEVERLKGGIARTRDELTLLKERLRETVGDDHLFFIDTHLLILADERLLGEAVAYITTDRINAEAALRQTLQRYREYFAGIDDPYLRERISDVETVIDKILRNMAGEPHAPITPDGDHTIIVAHDMSPADILQMDRSSIIGFITEIGGKTSHTSILARAFELPAVVGVEGIADMPLDGVPAILNGLDGTVIINPDSVTFLSHLRRKQHYEYVESELLKLAALEPETVDGHRLLLKGNVEVPEEGPSVLRHGGEGVGLYRTEMLFMNRREMPEEEEQYLVYAAMQRAVAPHPLTIRTLDAGGDKLLDGMQQPSEQNPVLGVRAIRLALRMPEEFKKQLRAILRVSAAGEVRIMFPLISGLEELRSARSLLEQAKDELDRAGIPFDRDIQVGIMIEVPSAVVVADQLARESDFFSVGTNDLIQYTLAIDRSNEQLVELYQPLHPAVLRSLRAVVDAAREAGVAACICGEMAGDPLYLPVLLGLGFCELSMAATSIPRVKQMLRRLSMEKAISIANACFGFDTAADVDQFLRNAISFDSMD